MEKCCETCRYDLGGGYDNCRINLESECAAGYYEAWEMKQQPDCEDYMDMVRLLAHTLASTGIMSKGIISIALSRPVEELFGENNN